MTDFVIVGAGSAGCVLANRLTEDPSIRVVLLEAGGPDRGLAVRIPAAAGMLFGGRYDWGYRTVPQHHLGGRRVYWARGKALGGSSTINAQVYLRGDPSDYERWEALGNDGWGYDGVLPYFLRSEHDERPGGHLGRDGPLNVASLRHPAPLSRDYVAACVAAGLRFNGDLSEELDGVGYPPVTQRNAMRWSAADAYLRPALGRSNLAVITGARVMRILFEGRRAVGVEYRKGGATHEARAGAEVVLSGGVVNSPQLLLLSGVGPAAHLQQHRVPVVHDLPGVGKNLQDHAGVAVQIPVRAGRLPAVAESILSLFQLAASRSGPLTSNASEALAFVRTEPSLPAADLEVVFTPPRLRPVLLTPRWALGRARFHLRRLAGGTPMGEPPRLVTVAPIVLQPRSSGSIGLSTNDPLAAPAIDPAYLSDDEACDLSLLVEGVRLVGRISSAPPFRRRLAGELWPGGREPDRLSLEDFVRERTVSLQHPVGTCKMGVDPMAVVDPSLRVHGVGGLRVVDASVIPVIPRGHTNAPAIMIAEKAADLIRSARSLDTTPLRGGVA